VYEIDYDRYFNPLNPAVYNQLSTMVKTEADSKATTGQFIFSGDLFELPAGAVGMAVAIEAGAQEYTLTPDPRILPGNAEIYNLTGTGGGGERDRYAVGVEFRVPLHETLSVSLAGRYDKYDDVTDVDDAISMNAGIEYRPVDNVLIRGSYATSFRAPDMHFVFADESGFFTGIFDEFNCRADGGDPTDAGGCIEDVAYNYQVFGTRTGSADLEEEEGKSWGAGVVWDITDNFSASLDWYRIELEGAVADISSAYVLREEAACLLGTTRDGAAVDPASAACQFFTSLVTRTVGGPNDGRVEEIRSFPINQSFLANEGLDATVSYRYDTENLGTFRLQGSWSHVLKEERELFPGDGVDEDYRDDLLRNPNFRSRARLTGSWAYGDFNTTLAANRLGSFSRYDADGRIAPYITYNASVRYQASENVALTLVGNNILNKRAPRDDSYAAYPYFWYAYSPIGRELFIQLDYRF
jgi:outer membrane receptor protein involved in Fe transport